MDLILNCLQITDDACAEDGSTILTLNLARGNNLAAEKIDLIPENDKYTFTYKCVTGMYSQLHR